ARNAEGKVILYADRITDSMRRAMKETERRRRLQNEYNEAHGIVPKTIRKDVREILEISRSAEDAQKRTGKRKLSDAEREATIQRLEKQMKEAAKMLEFELAAQLRDQIIELRNQTK
ncbi:MAG: UvrB/UvrC motif-containing protein, partial [Oscillospiraceae bacterium]|nr:UvrB/UvrC motif-containing protein [Oscillospiraceae bacterium]